MQQFYDRFSIVIFHFSNHNANRQQKIIFRVFYDQIMNLFSLNVDGNIEIEKCLCTLDISSPGLGELCLCQILISHQRSENNLMRRKEYSIEPFVQIY